MTPESPHELELSTLQLINLVVYCEQSRAHVRHIQSATGLLLPPSELRLILGLHGCSQSVSDMANTLSIDIAQVSRQASTLTKAGVIVRTRDPMDRRRTLMALSDSTHALVDRWLSGWLSRTAGLISEWPDSDLEHLARWFDYVHARFAAVVPHVAIFDQSRGCTLDLGDAAGPTLTRFAGSIAQLAHWVERSRGFNSLLESIDAPIHQQGYFTLRVVMTNGPMAIGDVADCMGIDHSQASKRLSQLRALGLVHRQADQTDRRSNNIWISDLGRTLMARVGAVQLEQFTALVLPIGSVDRELLTPLIQRFGQAVTAAMPQDLHTVAATPVEPRGAASI